MQRNRTPFRNANAGENSSVSSAAASINKEDNISTAYSQNPNEEIERSRSPSVVVRMAGPTVIRNRRDIAWGIRLIRKIATSCSIRPSQASRDFWYRASVLFITYVSYTCYHMTRKPISIVKNVLNQNCSTLTPPAGMDVSNHNWCNWAPFDGDDSQTLLGTLDSSFLFAYAIGMFFSGFIAERVNLRYFLALGMLISGLFTYMFGIGYFQQIHNIGFFIFAQVMAGLFQTTGWPGVVTVVANWFGKGKRGLIFGLWNSHTSLGNILGSVIAGAFVEYNWGLSFMVPGVVIGLVGFLVFLFLVPKPQHVGCTIPDYDPRSNDMPQSSRQSYQSTPSARDIRVPPPVLRSPGGANAQGFVNSDSDMDDSSSESNYRITDDTPLISSYLPYDYVRVGEIVSTPDEVKIKAVGFFAALKIPGVIEYSLCLFFAKLVSYTFLYWLPRYILNSTNFSAQQAANLSTLFDFGGIFGGIIAGAISDMSGMNASCCAGMLGIAIPMLGNVKTFVTSFAHGVQGSLFFGDCGFWMLVYQSYGAESLLANMVLLVIVGLLVNGPYCLITTSISTELGTHPSLMGNARALATVVAIIDGTGSIGAAVGPLLAGPLSDFGWKYVFYMLMISDVLALLLLCRLVLHEVQRLVHERRLR